MSNETTIKNSLLGRVSSPTRHSKFVAGDDPAAKEQVKGLLKALG
jgi:hypothetical protein